MASSLTPRVNARQGTLVVESAMSVESGQSFSFRPAEHLRRPSDFRRVYERRRSASDEWLIVYVCENARNYMRLGLSVSKKFGSARRRNRLRRLYREAFRLTRHEMPTGFDLVLIPRAEEIPSLEELKRSLPHLVSQAVRELAARGNRT